MNKQTMRRLADHFREAGRDATGGSLWIGIVFVEAARIIEAEIGPREPMAAPERDRLARAGCDIGEAARLVSRMIRGAEPMDAAKLSGMLANAARMLDGPAGAGAGAEGEAPPAAGGLAWDRAHATGAGSGGGQ